MKVHQLSPKRKRGVPVVKMRPHSVRNDRPTPARGVRGAVLCLVLVFSGQCALAAAEEPALRVGNPAPVLAFKDSRGASHTIDWTTGLPKAAVLFFFDPQSPPSLMEMTFLDTLLSRARDFGLAVYAIESKGRAPTDINQSLERYYALYRDPSFAMVPDPSFRLGALFGIRQAPTTFLVDGSGAIVLRLEDFEQITAVELTRTVERILKLEAGYFSFALRGLGVSEQGETALLARLAARDGQSESDSPKALQAGDRVPALEFVDLIGRSSSWEWPAAGAPARVVLFWGGLSIPDVEALVFLEKIYQTAHDAGLDILAVATGGLDDAQVQELMDRYRKYHSFPSYPIVADPDARLGKLFGGVDRTPRTYLVGADGVIVHESAGFSENQAATLAGKIENLLRTAGKTFPALGASTERSLAPAAPDEAPSIRQKQEHEDALGANLRRGDYYYYNGNWDKALSFYLRVIELDSRQVSVVTRVAQIYERLDDPANARAMWERVLTLQADNAEARKHLQKLGR
jgi:peroxiredoxin